MLKRLVFFTLISTAAATAAAAQSLADVARAEEARRKAIKSSSKVYTNETLRGDDGGPAPEAPAKPAPPAGAAAQSGTAADSPSPAASENTADVAKDEKYWRDRIANARNELRRSQTFAEALQSQINALYTEFVNTDDPVRRAAIEQKRLAAVAEQDQLKNEIAEKTKAVAAIEDEARRANVPAGWLR